MRIALLADFHLGFKGSNPSDPRFEDAFTLADEAMRLAAERADVILVAGDIFDRPRFSTEIFNRALDVFSPKGASDVSITLSDGTEPRFLGVPVIAVHGNHDVPAEIHKNPVLLLEKAYRLVYLGKHHRTAVMRKGDECVRVVGVGWIPDADPRVPQRFFSERVPAPELGCFNILLFHQPLRGIGSYVGGNPLDVSYLPPGFDAYVTGHLHWHVEKRVSDRWIIVPGSTIRTQLTDREVVSPRAFWILDTEKGTVEEVVLPSARAGYLVRVDASSPDVVQQIDAELARIAAQSHEKKPIVKLVLEGRVSVVPDLSRVLSRYSDRLLVYVFDRTTTSVSEVVERTLSQMRSSEVFSEEYLWKTLSELLSAAGYKTTTAFSKILRELSSLDPEDLDPSRLSDVLVSEDCFVVAKEWNKGTKEDRDAQPDSVEMDEEKRSDVGGAPRTEPNSRKNPTPPREGILRYIE